MDKEYWDYTRISTQVDSIRKIHTVHRRLCEHSAFAVDKKQFGINRTAWTIELEESPLE